MVVTPSEMLTSPLAVLPSIKFPFMTTKGFSSCCVLNQGVFLKAPYPINVTLSGIVILARFVQLLKAYPLMVVTLSGIVMLARFVQFANALSPINVTLLGVVKVMLVTVRPLNAVCKIDVTGLPSISFGIVIVSTEPE